MWYNQCGIINVVFNIYHGVCKVEGIRSLLSSQMINEIDVHVCVCVCMCAGVCAV